MKQINKEYECEVFVPYRICPLGAHTDHQKGIVTGFALNKGITLKYNETSDGSFNVHSCDFVGDAKFSYDEIPVKNGTWHDYLIGSILALKEEYTLEKGFNGYLEHSLPVGGLASSSSVIIAYLLTLSKINKIKLSSDELVKLVVKVEHKYLNVKVGVLDPSCEIYCKKNKLLYLDIKTKEKKLISCDNMQDFKICLIYSGLSRNLTNTVYNVRVDECKSAAFKIGSTIGYTPIDFESSYLRDISYEDFKKNKDLLSIEQYKRAIHFYTELERVENGVQCFENGNLSKFGQLIFESGKSSIENYETGSEQLKTIHNILSETPGVYGGRFSGAGFNGYCAALIQPDREEIIKEEVTKKYLKIYPQYKNKFNIFFCNTGDGAKI